MTNTYIVEQTEFHITERIQYDFTIEDMKVLTATGGGGMGAIGMGMINGGMDMFFNQTNADMDANRQVRTQRKLYDIAQQKQDEQNAKMYAQTEKWYNMYQSPEAQMRQYNEAGLNPALMYGKGGAGGSTAAPVQGQMSAPSAGGQGRGEGMGINVLQAAQVGLIQAQKENIEADTKKKTQDTSLSWQQTHAQQMENLMTEMSQAVRPDGSNAEGHVEESAAFKAKLQTLLGEGIKNTLMEKDIQLEEGQIQKMAADIAQRAQEIAISKEQVDINKMLAEWNTDWSNIIGKEAVEAVGGLIRALPFANLLGGKGGAMKTTTEGYNAKGDHYFQQRTTERHK